MLRPSVLRPLGISDDALRGARPDAHHSMRTLIPSSSFSIVVIRLTRFCRREEMSLRGLSQRQRQDTHAPVLLLGISVVPVVLRLLALARFDGKSTPQVGVRVGLQHRKFSDDHDEGLLIATHRRRGHLRASAHAASRLASRPPPRRGSLAVRLAPLRDLRSLFIVAEFDVGVGVGGGDGSGSGLARPARALLLPVEAEGSAGFAKRPRCGRIRAHGAGAGSLPRFLNASRASAASPRPDSGSQVSSSEPYPFHRTRYEILPFFCDRATRVGAPSQWSAPVIRLEERCCTPSCCP